MGESRCLALAERAEQVEEEPAASLWFGIGIVERLHQRLSLQALLDELRVVGDVQVACEHPLPLRARVSGLARCHRATLLRRRSVGHTLRRSRTRSQAATANRKQSAAIAAERPEVTWANGTPPDKRAQKATKAAAQPFA